MSLARQHFMKHSAKAAAETAAEFGTMQEQSFYELQLAQLNNDRHRLKQIQSTEAKVKLKEALVPTYLPYVDGIMEANKTVQDVVFMTLLVWCIDIENYAKALEMAEFALLHDMLMPDRFDRKTATLVTEEIANAFLKKLKSSADVDIEVLQELEQLVLHTEFDEKLPDMPDQVKSKLLVALGKATIKQIKSKDEPDDLDIESAQNAQAYLQRAIELDDKCGGKQDLKTVDALLKKFPSETQEQVENDQDNDPSKTT